jgi:hypothetical protein
LITPEKIVATVRTSFWEETNFTSIQFSPDDAYLCLNGYHHIAICNMRNPQAPPIEYREADLYVSYIRKIFFSPGSTKILVALKNGRLICGSDFFKKPTLKFCNYDPFRVIWRCEDVASIDNQAPLILWGNNDLLFSLDPANHTDQNIFTFVIRNSSTGKFLMAYNFFPHNPIAMGLAKDERSVIFMHKNDKMSQILLYPSRENENIDFIENKASLYELCCLWQIGKSWPEKQLDGQNDKNASKFIEKMQSMIGKVQING